MDDAMNLRSKIDAAHPSMLDALLMVGRDGSIEFANQHAERLFGDEPGQLVGVEIEALIPERFRPRHVEARAEFSVDPAVRPMGYGWELFALRSDGLELPVEIGLGPANREGGAVVLVRDISDQVMSRQGLERATVELERSRVGLQAEAEALRESSDQEQESHGGVGPLPRSV